MSKYLLGIDNGGTFSKAAIFDIDGNQIEVASMQTEILTPHPGYTERDLKKLWEVNLECIKMVIDKSGVDPKNILGISLSGHGKGLYLVGDKDNLFIHNGIISTDSRARKYVSDWNSDGTKEKVFQKTYQNIMAFQPVSLLAWFKDNKPDILDKAKYIFAVKDFIRYMLTGEAYAEYTDFSGSNLINMNTKEYDIELLKHFGIDEIINKLPKLRYSSEITGYITKEVSKVTGLKEGTPVAAGMFDVNACGIATGLVSEEELSMIAGTWSINQYISKSPIKNKSISLNSMFCMEDYYLIEESSPTSAGNLEWVIENILQKDLENAKKNNNSIYDLINEMASKVSISEENVVFLPFLNGSNYDPKGKGSFVGITSFHKKEHLIRAVFEGVVFSHLTHLNKLLLNREKPKSIRLSGGASNSSEWVQIFADVLQIPIDVIADKELGAQGAAMVAGIAVGVYSDYKDAVNKTLKISKTVYPRKDYFKIYQNKYNIYKKIVDSLNNVWNFFEN